MPEKKTKTTTTPKETTPTPVSAKPSTTKKAKSKRPSIPKEAFYATGKRKSSIAKVWVYPGKGTILMNGDSVKGYIKRDGLVSQIEKPLAVLNFSTKYDVQIKVTGGGLTGQAGAAQLGIARALLTINEEYRKSLRDNNLLSRDSRIKERKKYGLRGARKGPTYRKR